MEERDDPFAWHQLVELALVRHALHGIVSRALLYINGGTGAPHPMCTWILLL
jgi:hypothetical protein